MPQRKCAKEELKKSITRKQHNISRKRTLKEAIKAYKQAVEANNIEESRNALKKVYTTLDKAAAKKVIHPRKAARKKSRLSSLLNTATSDKKQKKSS